MIWLDKYFKEYINEIYSNFIYGSKYNCFNDKDRKTYQSLLKNYDKLNMVEKALLSMSFQINFTDMVSIATGGNLQRILLIRYIIEMFKDSINKLILSTKHMQSIIAFSHHKYSKAENILGDLTSIKVSNGIVSSFVNTNIPDIHYTEVIGDNIYYIDMPNSFMIDEYSKINAFIVSASYIIIAYTMPGLKIANSSGISVIVLDENLRPIEVQANGMFNLINMGLVNRITDVIKMIILYYQSTNKRERNLNIKDKSNSITPEIDKRDKKYLKNSKHQDIKKIKSSFKLKYLSKPISDKNWNNTKERSWALSHSVKVNGYWRWQRHGINNSLRKLIYVKEYIKGKGKGEEDFRASMTVI